MGGQASEVVFDSTQFQDILLTLRLRAISQDLPSLEIGLTRPEVNWNFALLCASALTSDESEPAQIAVLRVASGCLLDATTSPEQRLAAAALLEREGNGLAVTLAERHGKVKPDAWAELPVALKLEVVRSKIRHSVRLSNGRILSVNGFQSDLWDDASKARWLSVSAPTSSGKSRIIREWFLEQLRTHEKFSAVYIVPTRALIEEVSAEFRKHVEHPTAVFMMPWDPEVFSATNRVLVMTQERLHLIQTTRPDFHVDLIFVDEAQSLGAAQRGILLQQVIDRTVAANPDVQLIFASPLSANPELLLENHPVAVSTASLASETVTVNQNLLRIEPVFRKPLERSVSLIHGGKPLPVGAMRLPDKPTTVSKRIAFVAHALGRQHGGNIVYANRPDDAEKIAAELYTLVGKTTLPLDPEVEELQSLISTAVHPNYTLVDVLARGIAFHYGNMPLAIRAEIERLFEEEKINFLVCTSTLLEGVNLPCKTIFIRAPRKGLGTRMSELDFWNLAGRAGRWGKEFQGNVICIDTQDPDGWPDPPAVRGRFPLKRAVRSGLTEPTALVDYLATAETTVSGNIDGENLFSYLAARLVNGSDLSKELAAIEDDAFRESIRDQVVKVVGDIEFPAELIPRHAGISPIAMTKLLRLFRESNLPPTALALPRPNHQNARALYQAAFVRLGASMTTAFGTPPQFGDDKRKWQIANLVVNWMNGMPLHRLIEQRAASHPLAQAIRDVMADIENVVRFQSAKYLACYNDVLDIYLKEKGEIGNGPNFDVTMMLELGVSRQSQVVLMSVGLSRTTTLAIADLIPSDDWTPQEATAWLKETDFKSVAIPAALKREIATLVGQKD